MLCRAPPGLAAALAGAAGCAGAAAVPEWLTMASMIWSESPAFLRATSPLVLVSNLVALERIFVRISESDSPAFFMEMTESFVSTSCALIDVALSRVSAATASTSVSRSLAVTSIIMPSRLVTKGVRVRCAIFIEVVRRPCQGNAALPAKGACLDPAPSRVIPVQHGARTPGERGRAAQWGLEDE